MDLPAVLARSRQRPITIAGVLAGAAAVTAIVAADGGAPTPLTHLFYVVVLAGAVFWGAGWAVALGAVCGVLAGPGVALLLGKPIDIDDGWWVRAVALALVGGVCGALTGSLLARLRDLQRLNTEMISAFVRAIDARDPYTARHSEKVAAYALRLAEAMGLDLASCERIRLAGLLHDVGKVGLERSVLHKDGPLSDAEWQQVREHPLLSAHIIGGVKQFAAFVAGARHHHERVDGRGYPDGIAGDEIPLDARILAVADAFDAMTSDRSYRPALSREEAFERLVEGAGTQFDPACVEAFVALDPDPVRLELELAPVLGLPPLQAIDR